MNSGAKNRLLQLVREALPLDRNERVATEEGIERLEDRDAAEIAERLRTALDALPYALTKLDQLIEALQIFLKYGNSSYPTYCEHDVLHIAIDPEKVSEDDKRRLDELGFFVGKEWPDHFISFRYG
jgi:hypothetical protein